MVIAVASVISGKGFTTFVHVALVVSGFAILARTFAAP